MNKLLETCQKYPQTQIWNDSCSQSELSFAIENGACGATTNPVIVCNVLKNELNDFEKDIIEAIREYETASEDDIAWMLIEKMGRKASELLLPQFIESNGTRGRISFQTNAKYYRDPIRTFEHAKKLAAVCDNSQIKAPTSKAGIQAFEEMTYAGISINATVSFTHAQAIAVAEAVERGLNRRVSEGLPIDHMNPVCTIMVGRVDDYLKGYVSEHNISIDQSVLDYAGIATFKNAYKTYQAKNYRTKLLAAAYRNIGHWSEFIGGDVVLTITHGWQEKIMNSEIEVKERINDDIDSNILEQLKTLEEFNKAYEPDGLTQEEFEHYGAFKITMRQFLNGYDELVSIIRSYMI